MKLIEKYQLGKLVSSKEIKEIAAQLTSAYVLIYTSENEISFGKFAEERMLQVAEDSSAGILYTDYLIEKNGQLKQCPLIDYQLGSLRDDFDFGPVFLICAKALREAAIQMKADYLFAGLYDLRLKISQKESIVHLDEFLYTETIQAEVDSEARQFAYVDPKNRAVQIEMEAVCTDHLKKIGAYLHPVFKSFRFDENQFDFEASVIIPVKNRVKTIDDAIKSVLQQETTFDYNLIIVDNHSTDGTTEIIRKYTEDRRIIHIIPKEQDLNIGGCWNLAVHHPLCGKFAIQLDSDDLYAHENVLEIIVNEFYHQECAMIVGAYKMVNFNLEMISPGIIEHKEWTPENGRNNALRINGLGAPRAFYTPLLRQLNLPNTGYGEDYAIGLRISREYQIGRIYDVLYFCRRWEENTDASISSEKLNKFNTYKDKLRTWELQGRMKKIQHLK